MLENVNENIGELIYRYKQEGLLPAAEQSVLDAWVAASDYNKRFFERALDSDVLLQDYSDWCKAGQLSDPKDVWGRMVEGGMVPGEAKRSWVVGWQKYAAAAAIVVSLLVVGYYFINDRSKETVAESPKDNTQSKIVPGANRAVLTLSDGRKVLLDSAAPENIIKDGAIQILNKDGHLAYTPAVGGNGAVIFNTLSTSNGQTYSTILSDGSKVWLNAASTIKYPLAFNQVERGVEISGEAYFEVASYKKSPFKVLVDGIVVEVTGTTFNISAYKDHAQIKTTLVEGGVKIYPAAEGVAKAKLLRPGQQAKASPNAQSIDIVNDVDLEEVLSWRNGLFVFNSAKTPDIMKQLERWYNIETRYIGDVGDLTFTGQIPKYSRITDVLSMLEEMQKTHFKVEGRTVIVSKR